MIMKSVSSVLSFGPSSHAKAFNLTRLLISAWCWVMAGLVFLPATFRAWSADCVPPQSSLVAWWPGEGNANDIAGTNNGTLQGGATFTTGVVGQALNLNGSSQYVDVPNSAGLNPTASISLEAWIYPRLPLNSVGSPIIKKAGEGLGQQDGYTLEFSGTDGVVFGVNVNGTVWWLATDPAPVPFSQWSHVAGVYDGTNVSIYVNGLLVSRKLGAHPAPIVPSANHLQLGHDPSNPSRYFNGLIDEASIYRTALSSAQIQAIYTAGSAGKCVPQPANCVPPPSGLVGWWPGDGNANDIGGTNNGTLQGGATFTTGKVGQAINLNGSSQYLDVPSSASLNPTSSVSLEAWIYPRLPLNSVGSPIIKKAGEGLGQQDGYSLEFSGTDGVVFAVNVDGTVWWLATDPAPVPFSQWSHVAGVYDGTNVSIYVNGLLVSRKLGAHPAPIVSSANHLQLGHDPSNPSRYFNGLIDEASIYRTALSSAQIQAIYAAGSAGKCAPQPANCVPPPSGLIGWWPGDGNANDIGGTNNGTLQGGATFTTGKVGQAINLNGSSQYVDVPNRASLNPTTSISLEAWIYPRLPLNSIGSPIIKKAGEGLAQQDGYSLEFMGTNGVIFSVNVNGTVWGFATDPAPVPFSQWSHVAGVYDGTNVSIYVNGLLVSRKLGAHSAPIVPSANHLQLGHDPSNPSRYFNGLIDEASIYSTALSSAQIQAIYTAGSAGKCVVQPSNCIPPPSGLAGWWPGQGNANDLTDANNGTLSGDVSFANGEVGQAFNFNPASGTVIVPDSPSLRLTNQLTIEAWINARSLDDVIGCAIVSKISINSGNNGYQLILVGNTLQGLLNSPGLSWPSQWIISGPIISTGLWYHVAFTYDQSAMKLYCNGQQVATSVIGAHAIATSPSELRVSGADYHGYFDGLIDEPSVYNRALSAGEIAAIYNAGSAGKCGSAITPLPRAATATATMVNDFVVGATITDGGWGYTNIPIIRISGGGGSGARAVAVVSNGVVIAINILDAGYGYTSMPLVVIDPPFMANPVLDIAPMSFLVFSNLTVGGVYQMQQWVGWYWSNRPVSFTATNTLYTQMAAGVVGSGDYRLALNPVPAHAFATAQVVNGFVVGATVTSRGSGYVTTPAVTIFGGGGINATAVAHISGGVVTSITITDAGIGFTNAPTVRIAPPPAAAVSPMVLPVMRLNSANLVPYDNYQIQFKPDLGEAWGNWTGGLFIPTDVTSSQYVFVTNDVGFFRLLYVP